MRVAKATVYASLVMVTILLLIDMDYPVTMKEISEIDGGTILFLLLIVATSQLYAHKVFGVYRKLTDKITVGVWSNILAIVSVYAVMGICYLITGTH